VKRTRYARFELFAFWQTRDVARTKPSEHARTRVLTDGELRLVSGMPREPWKGVWQHQRACGQNLLAYLSMSEPFAEPSVITFVVGPSLSTAKLACLTGGVAQHSADSHMYAVKRANHVDRHLGLRLRMRRLALRMSQTALAELLGITFQQVQKYEKGTNRVSASTLQKLSESLQVPVAYFFEGSAQGAVLDAPHTEWAEFLFVPEGLALMKAFQNIHNKEVRRALVELAVRLGSKG
jgi:transcriptional regulator with XRE-family HTH domain